MNIEQSLTATFADHEHLAPDAADVLSHIRAELDRGRRRYLTRLAPILAAAVILAVVLTVVVVRSVAGHPGRPADHSLSGVASDPEAVARTTAHAILREVPLPSGARASDTEPAALKSGPVAQLSSLEAEASGVWLAPGSVPATVAFARAHPAPGFTPNCTCHTPAVKWVDFFSRDDSREITYVVAPHASGVAIKITVIVPWAPTRPRWSYVAGTAASVDVTVQRVRGAGPVGVGGAPTIHRTLTTAATRRLAAVANGLHAQAPPICFGPPVALAATDKLVFHEPTRTITFTMKPSSCPQFSVEVSGQKPAYLEWGPLDTALLHELHLPPDYGH